MSDPGLTPTHVPINAGLMVALTFFHVLSSASVLFNLLGRALELPIFRAPRDEAELIGNMIAFAWMGLMALVGAVWAPINAYGLFRKRAWARRSTLGYWAFVGLGCCCIPGAAYGIYSLTRQPVVDALRDQ